MATRRNMLLLVLLVLVGIAIRVYWPEPKTVRPPDPATLTVPQLIAGLSGEQSLWNLLELSNRGWLEGPESIESVLAHEDVQLRRWATFTAFPSTDFLRNRSTRAPDMASRWRDRLLRAMAEDPDVHVRESAAHSLAMLVGEELLDDSPQPLLDQLRVMITASADHSRFRACVALMSLGQRGAVLRDQLLAMDTRKSDDGVPLKVFVCSALEGLGVDEPRVTRYLLEALADDDAGVREAAARALGPLGEGNPEVTRQLLARFEDAGEARDVRSAALVSLGRLADEPTTVASLLRATLRSSDLFVDQNHIDWVTCLVAFAVRTTEQPLRSAAVQALVLAGEDQTRFSLDVGLAGGVARIAVAQHDEQLLLDVMPRLLEQLEATQDNREDGAWTAWEREHKLAFEALVDVCVWRDDRALSETVHAALQNIADHQMSWTRKWARAQIARLAG